MEMREDSIVRLELVPKSLSYDELSEATGGFSEESELGHGGFGVVYKAELKSGIHVAVKRMNHASTYRQGIKEFRSEVLIISQLSHRNLIKLRGWCADAARKEYMLVYDLMPNGSLDDILFKSAERTDYPSWPQKFNILTGAADGLDYLHRGWNQQIIHRDIKCSNILMDKDGNPKLGDFGIARLVDHHGKAATTAMAGTVGYMAPEVFSEYQFTDKADVYSFGVVMLEVACGRRVLPSFPHNTGLVQWVRSAYSSGNLLSVVDKRHSAFDTRQMKMVLKVGLLCTQSNPKDRPPLRSIVQMLAGDVKVPAMPGLKATVGRFYGSVGILSIMRNLVSSERLNRSATLVDDDKIVEEVPSALAIDSGGAHIATSVDSLVMPAASGRSNISRRVNSLGNSSPSGTSGNHASSVRTIRKEKTPSSDNKTAVEVHPVVLAALGGTPITLGKDSLVSSSANGTPGNLEFVDISSAELALLAERNPTSKLLLNPLSGIPWK